MKEILSKYRERLINLSSRNRSLVMKKIYKKRAFDLSRLNSKDREISDELLEFIISRTEKKLLLLDDPYKERIERINQLEDTIRTDKKNELNELIDKISDTEELKKQKDLINKKYEEKLNTETEKIEKEIEKLIDYSTSLSYLHREINALEKETGRYELFVGYPFVEGRFQDRTFVKAPLLLFPIRILKDNNRWHMQNIQEQDILINKVFVFAYAKYNEIKIKDFETEFSSLDDFNEEKIESILKYLYDNKITIQDIGSRQIERFIDYTEKNIPTYKNGELVLKNYLILGQFPISNSIYNDYQLLEKQDTDNELLRKLLVNGSEYEQTDMDNDNDGDRLSLSEEDIFFLTPLDYSQENAVNNVNKTDQLVIYGPPGTGKSQTIANIITDALAKGKKILMVSQKKAALDVIYNRLSDLNSKITLIHDANKDKKAFYDKVNRIIDDIQVDSNNERIFESIKVKARTIDQGIKSLEKIATILHQPRDFGLTLQQMYSKTKNINSKEDTRFNDFRVFRHNNKFTNYTYQQLRSAIDNISCNIVLDNYFKNKKMLLDNYMLDELNPNFDYLEAQEIENSIEQIAKCTEYIKILSMDNKQFSLLVSKYKEKKYNVADNDLIVLAGDINKSENGYLLVPLNNGRWWSFVYWLNYGKNKKQEEENKKEYNIREQKIYEEIKKWNNIIKEAIDNTEIIKSILKEDSYFKIIGQLLKGEQLSEKLFKLVDAIEDYEEYRTTSYKVNLLSHLEKELLEYANKGTNNSENLKIELNKILDCVILSKILEVEKTIDDTSLLDYSRFDELTASIYKLMIEKNKLTPKLIMNDWNLRLINLMNSGAFREYKRQAGKKRMLWPIRKYITEFETLVFNTFPCWLLSPETVSDILPLNEGMFDMIIFDEASQLFIENAIPTIFRGKQVIVAGDDKQLKPSSTFKVKFDDIDEEEMSLETAAALEEESLLDLAKVNYDSVYLNYHYRSQYDELINFSNYAFYGGKLQVSPNIAHTNAIQPPIQRIKIDGTWIDRKNIKEAEKVVELVSEILMKRKNNETIGIITFNISQKDLIEDLLERKCRIDPEFKVRYTVEIDRKTGNEDVSLFVKNIENVQGDERDIVIFSIGYAPNEHGRISVNFGALSQDGGENRLNVAISRAKRKVFIVTSIEPEELSVDGTKNLGPKLFKKYLQYAKEVSNGNIQNANEILYSLIDSDVEMNKSVNYDSDFEMEVRDALVEKGYIIHTQVGVSGYKIDLAVYDKVSSKYILGIECDGATYHSSKSARERDIHRQRYLESRGWKIVRIWSRDWWRNQSTEINKIESIINLYERKESDKGANKHVELKVVQSNQMRVITNDKAIAHKKPKEKIVGAESLIDRNTIWYGDSVVLRDIVTKETYEITLEANKYNREFMKDIEKKLLGHNIEEKFNYSGFVYEVMKVNKNIRTGL
ncbi:AAA domain-containing protein [Brassicibacter mesophilus]|uniref:AAA domain-containing protein n=1 Tax=Brassicibacter mesophilus TaxID=745119 RepID=UPI003D198E09